MKNFLIVSCFLLAFFLRFYQLGDNPPSLDWDEASLGYNAYSLLKTGRDEYGRFLPLSLRSFGDYKPAVYAYLTLPFVSLFGLSEFATRLPSAVFGFFTTVVVYFLSREFFSDRKKKYSLLVLFFLSISPWHIQFSRIAFEANIALFFFVCGILFVLKSRRASTYLPISSVAFSLSMYSYHSPRLLVPILLIGFLVLYGKQILRGVSWVIVSAVLLLLLLFPLFQDMRSGQAGARFQSVTVLNPHERLSESIAEIEYDQRRNDILGRFIHNRRFVYAREVFAGYLDHFSIDFLFLRGDPPGRHHAAGMGMLYWWEAGFLIIGLFHTARKKTPAFLFLFWWFFTAPIASSFTTGTPHAVRALFFLPTFQIFSAIGVLNFLENIPFGSYVAKRLFLVILLSGNIFYFLHMYWIHTPKEYAKEWQWGYKQAVEAIAPFEDQFDRIVMTYRYDQPYIFVLFYRQVDPVWYQRYGHTGEILRSERRFGKYEFRNLDWTRDREHRGVLFVGTGEEIPDDWWGVLRDIRFPDGSVAFRIAAT